MQSNLIHVLEFLTSLVEEGRSYNTVNIHRSMLSKTLPQIDSVALGSHPLVKLLLKGCYNIRPPLPRYVSTWDPDIVFSFMRSSVDRSLRWIAHKTVTLLALLSLLRTAELAMIDYSSISFGTNSVSFSLMKPRKSQHQGPLQRVSLQNNREGSICPSACIREYLSFSSCWRDATRPDQRSLFLGLISPHASASGCSIGKWIKAYLNLAGIDTGTFSAHSTRGAAASKAVNTGVPIDSILKAGQWANVATFNKFYHRSL